MINKKSTFHVFIGTIIFLLIAFVLPRNVFSIEASLAIATMTLMIYWWITRPVHIAIVALLPIAVNALTKMAPMGTVLDDYASPIIVLLLGANIITLTWTLCGLDKKIALRALTIIGTSLKGQLVVWFLLSTLFSTVLPNTVVVAVMCPIAIAMLKYASTEDIDLKNSKTKYLILLAIAWGAGLGGFGTPLGGAMNLVAITHIETITGSELMYVTWIVKMLPYLLLLTASVLTYILFLKTDIKHLPGSKNYFKNEYRNLGKINRTQIISLIMFILPVLLSFARPLYSNLIPEFKPFYAFLISAIILMLVKNDKKERLITWEYAAKNINWGLMILFSGGLAIGNLLISTGAVESISQLVSMLNLNNTLLIILVISSLGMFFANTSSNTAATAVLIPIVIGVVAMMNKEPLNYIFIAAVACNCAFILPTSIRAIPVGYGLDVNFMLKKGLAAVGITLIVLTFSGYITLLIQ